MQKLIELIERFIKTKFGEDSLKVFKTIGIKENVSEFKIAEDLKKNINYIRNLLYKFYSHHLVYSTRKKDRQKGWYIYYWTFNFKHARDLLIIDKTKRLEKLKAILNKEVYEEIYVCPNGCTKFRVEDAMEYNFKCPECEAILVKKEDHNEDEKIKEEIEKLEKDIEILKRPIEIKLIKEEERVVKKPKKKRRKIIKKVRRKSKKVKKRIKKKRKKVKRKPKKRLRLKKKAKRIVKKEKPKRKIVKKRLKKKRKRKLKKSKPVKKKKKKQNPKRAFLVN